MPMTETRPAPRRRASQTRSKATVQKILDAATALIIERGAEPVTMSEIARRAGLVIGSLYQYFSDRSAIHRAILIRHAADARTLLHHHVSGVRTLDGLSTAIEAGYDGYLELLQKDRLVVGLWAIVQSDPELHALDLEDTLQNARYIASSAAPMLRGVDRERLTAINVLLIQFSFYAARLARDAAEPLATAITPAFKHILRSSFETLQAEALSEASPNT